MERWQGKVAVVTGGSAGIGKAIVRKLVAHQVLTIALSRRFHIVEEMKAEMNDDEAAFLYSRECDITNEEQVSSTFMWIKENFEAVHILINNAGLLTSATFLEGPIENWKKVVDVNLFGTCNVTKEFFEVMNAACVNDGHIININSTSGHRVPKLGTPLHMYPATKHGITAFSYSLRLELAEKNLKTKVTSISPGLVETELLDANGSMATDDTTFNISIKPEDVADAVIFALSTNPNVNINEIILESVYNIY